MRRLRQNGQLPPLDRLATVASHTWSLFFRQIQDAVWWENCPTESGATKLSGFHSFINSGRRLAKSFTPATTLFPEQTGHPEREWTRCAMRAFQVWRLSAEHCHQASACVEGATSLGSRVFRLGCHSAATLGASVRRSLTPGMTTRLRHTGQEFLTLLNGARHLCLLSSEQRSSTTSTPRGLADAEIGSAR